MDPLQRGLLEATYRALENGKAFINYNLHTRGPKHAN
jgi:hypothetical protein